MVDLPSQAVGVPSKLRSVRLVIMSSDDDPSSIGAPQGSKSGLRRGWTTGACAAAGARAAYETLLTGHSPTSVTISLPRGLRPTFAVERCALHGDGATAAIIKDAGDDPDVTHGATILTTVAHAAPRSGIAYRAGEGVGTVTRPGLQLAVGEPAINPGPRSMIAAAIRDAADEHGGTGDVIVTVAVPGGETLAAKTLNARLGIVGGLSILGTTGVVVPYSCAAWIHSIHRGIDVARAVGHSHIAASTGSTSEAAVKALYQLPDEALLDMGDFVGGTLKYLREHPVPWLTLAGGFGKLAKLAAGHLDLHSSRSQVDQAALAALAADLGAEASAAARIAAAGSAAEGQAIAAEAGIALAPAVAARAREVAMATLSGGIRLDVCIFDRSGTLIGHARP
jgi:cobalt-precorrin-5B (C1)-methyltransferase